MFVGLEFLNRLSQTESQATTVRFYPNNLEGDNVPFFYYLFRVLDPAVCQLGDMNKPLYRPFNMRKGSKGGQLGDGTSYKLPFRVFANHRVPFFWVRSPQTQADLLVFVVHLEHIDVHLISNLHHVFWTSYPAPRKLRKVDQAFCAAQIDKDAKGANTRNFSVADNPFL